ncbi:MAG: hypothetical protein O3C51_16090 [Planctomycetota bacterium]|nr:hypothetical protein [Planctomycetota bacterium]MDA1223137.1 hypothetical protein [Planctomycetota bacterium]
MQTPVAVPVSSHAQPSDGELMAFLAPGLVHALGNHLFAIQGSAHVLKEGKAGLRERGTILEASNRAQQALDILRLLATPDEEPASVEQPGVLLTQLAPLCAVPLRERGLRHHLDFTSPRSRPRGVPARRFVRAYLGLLQRVSEGLPPFVHGTLTTELKRQDQGSVTFEIAVEFAAHCLPFPVDIDGIVSDCNGRHAADGVVAEAVDGRRMRVQVGTAE